MFNIMPHINALVILTYASSSFVLMVSPETVQSCQLIVSNLVAMQMRFAHEGKYVAFASKRSNALILRP